MPGKQRTWSSRAAMGHATSTAGCHRPAAAPALSWWPGSGALKLDLYLQLVLAKCEGICETWTSSERSLGSPWLTCKVMQVVSNTLRCYCRQTGCLQLGNTAPHQRWKVLSRSPRPCLSDSPSLPEAAGKKQGLLSTKHRASYLQGWVVIL